jgi:hypothetical protein
MAEKMTTPMVLEGGSMPADTPLPMTNRLPGFVEHGRVGADG